MNKYILNKPRIPCGQVCLWQIMQTNESANQVTCMINFDDLEFSGCRSEENNKFIFTLSVYQYQRAYILGPYGRRRRDNATVPESGKNI